MPADGQIKPAFQAAGYAVGVYTPKSLLVAGSAFFESAP